MSSRFPRRCIEVVKSVLPIGLLSLLSAAGVQDALLSPPAPTGMEETVAYEMMPFGLLSVEDVIQPVTRAAQAAAKERCGGTPKCS